MSVTSLLQLATRAGIPRQSEIRSNSPVASSFLRSLLILVTPILSTNGTSERRISDQDQEYSLLIRKRRHHTIELGSIDPDVKWIRNNVSFAASHSADTWSVEFLRARDMVDVKAREKQLRERLAELEGRLHRIEDHLEQPPDQGLGGQCD